MNEQNTRDKESIWTKKNRIIAGSGALLLCLIIIILVSCGTNQSNKPQQETAASGKVIEISDRDWNQSDDIEDVTASAVTVEAVTMDAVTAEAVTVQAVTPEVVTPETVSNQEADAQAANQSVSQSGNKSGVSSKSDASKNNWYENYDYTVDEDGFINIEIPTAATHLKDAYLSNNTSALTEDEKRAFVKLQEVMNCAKAFSHPAEQEKAVHDWIVDHVEYDYSYDCQSYDVIGVLINGKGVCSGYAGTFKLCMDLLNIECKSISGFADNGDTSRYRGHDWNAVKLDGEWYMVDVTWNDIVRNGVKRYAYYNVTDAVMKQDHRYSASIQCNGTKYAYFNYYDKVCQTIDETYDQIAQEVKQGKTSFSINVTENVRNSLTYSNHNTRNFFDNSQISVRAGRAVLVTIADEADRMAKTSDGQEVKILQLEVQYYTDTLQTPVVFSKEEIKTAVVEALDAGYTKLEIYCVGTEGDWFKETDWSDQIGVVPMNGWCHKLGHNLVKYTVDLEDRRDEVLYTLEEIEAALLAAPVGEMFTITFVKMDITELENKYIEPGKCARIVWVDNDGWCCYSLSFSEKVSSQ